jgi:hypothetical protein
MTEPDGEPEHGLRAWLIEYADQALSGTAAFAVINKPRTVWAYSRAVSATAALANEATLPVGSDAFVFVFVPAGSSTAYDVQKQAEQWMATRPGEPDGMMEVVFRSERLLWRRGRALCFGTPQLVNDMLAAVTHFGLCEGDLSRLEQQADDACATLEKDKHLSDNLRWGDLKRRPHIDAMTRTAVDMRLTYLNIDKALEAPSADISGLARRVFIELTTLATARNRLDRLDDVIDAVLEQYRFVNDRFSDFRYHMREYCLIALILSLIFMQFIVESKQIWRPALSHLIGLELPSSSNR